MGSPHLAKRMKDRQFGETDLREMMESATGFHPDYEPGRWVVETRWRDDAWEVIVEPLPDEQLLMAITAYKVEPEVSL